MKKTTWHFRTWVEVVLEIICVCAFICMVSVNPTLGGIVVFILSALTILGCGTLLKKYGKHFQ